MYAKIFSSIFDGTLATSGNWQALVTFQQMLILCDPTGIIDMTPEALARRTTLPIDIIQAGIAALEQPDTHSRSTAEDGRRIVRLNVNRPWGWRIVNHGPYRAIRNEDDRREYMRAYMSDKRAGKPTGERAKSAPAKPRKAKPVAEPFALPDWVPGDLWATWQEVRVAKKAVQTPATMAVCLADLTALRQAGHDPKAVLRAAIGGSWKSLHAPDRGNGAAKPEGPKQPNSCAGCGKPLVKGWTQTSSGPKCEPCWQAR